MSSFQQTPANHRDHLSVWRPIDHPTIMQPFYSPPNSSTQFNTDIWCIHPFIHISIIHLSIHLPTNQPIKSTHSSINLSFNLFVFRPTISQIHSSTHPKPIHQPSTHTTTSRRFWSSYRLLWPRFCGRCSRCSSRSW